MTYCVGLLVDTGLVMLSDSRTNAGVDQINTFRKMATFQHAQDRVLVLLSAGNLGITQAVVNLLETAEDPAQPTRFLSAPNMFAAARVVGDALRSIHERRRRGLARTWLRIQRHLHPRGPDQGRRAAAVSHSTRRATSSNPPSIRPTFKSANRSTASPSSTA